MNDINIKVENTAIKNGVAKSIKDFSSLMKNKNILDYGTGKLRNAKYLLENNMKVSILDIPEQIEKIKKEDKDLFENIYTTKCIPNILFDVILCTYVLNVIPEKNDRDILIKNIYKILDINGIVVVEVRKDKGILANKYRQAYKDGYLIGNGQTRTFQKPFSLEELKSIFIGNNFKIINSKSYNDSVCIIAKKEA